MPRKRLTLKELQALAEKCGLYVAHLAGRPTRYKITDRKKDYRDVAKPLFHTDNAHEIVAWLEGYELGYKDGLDHADDEEE